MAYKIWDNVNGLRDATAEETIEIDAKEKAYTDNGANRKLTQIKEIRLQKLKETDYLANSDVTMPNNVKTWRQTLRDLPANHVDEAAYDLLLVKDAEGKLTHSIWSKP
jgi:hypothetical protein